MTLTVGVYIVFLIPISLSQIYFGLLTERAAALVGHIDIIVDGITLKSMLGRGMHCTAFEGLRNCDNMALVAKVFHHSQHAAALKQERDSLEAMATIPNIPRVAAQTIAKGDTVYQVLLLTPVGRPVRPVLGGELCSGSQISKLVSVLRSAHDMGIAHRDVKPGMYCVCSELSH